MTKIQNIDDLLAGIERWYASQCNGDWEHTYGIFIRNIDNPGWSLKVELKHTHLYEIDFEQLQIQREDENDWIVCEVKNGDFQGYGGPANLRELVQIFLSWAEKNKPTLK